MRLNAVLLAAGAGRRFGGSKLTASHRGRPLLTYALDSALAAPVQRAILVTGFHREAVRAAAEAHAAEAVAQGRLRFVHAENAAEGLGASLRTGVEAARDADGVYVFLADMPDIPESLAGELAERLTPGIEAVAPMWRGRRGHPVLFGARAGDRLLHASGDTGAQALLASLGSRLALVEAVGPGVLRDVDTASDLQDAMRHPRVEPPREPP